MTLQESALREFVTDRLAIFRDERENKLSSKKASELLQSKNPYLFRYRGFEDTQALVKALLLAWLSSSEETIFGHALEDIAVYICQETFGGAKSPAEGIDLDFQRDGKRYLVSIKSGPNWGNSPQIAKMKDHFGKARRVLKQNKYSGELVFVNGCCYGRTAHHGGYHSKDDYYKYCGKDFWELISGDADMYLKLIDIVADAADQLAPSDDELLMSPAINTAIQDIEDKYRDSDGTLDWHALLSEFHSRD